ALRAGERLAHLEAATGHRNGDAVAARDVDERRYTPCHPAHRVGSGRARVPVCLSDASRAAVACVGIRHLLRRARPAGAGGVPSVWPAPRTTGKRLSFHGRPAHADPRVFRVAFARPTGVAWAAAAAK